MLLTANEKIHLNAPKRSGIGGYSARIVKYSKGIINLNNPNK